MAREHRTSRTPNWRDRSSYGYTLSLSKRGWAWEFLRRNPQLRKVARRLKAGSVTIGQQDHMVRVATTLAALEPIMDWGILFFRRSE